MSADIKGKVDAASKKIVSGEIKLAATYKEAKSLAGFPQNLKAQD
jgi:hypothetical protein